MERFRSQEMQRVLRFLVSGTTSAAVNLSILFVLVDFANIHYLSASVASYILSIVAGFLLQKFWTFRDNVSDQIHTQFAVFTMVAIVNLCINTALMYTFVSVIGIWYLAAQVLAGLLIACISYVSYRKLVFNQASSR